MRILVTGKNGFLAKNAIDWFGKEHDLFALSHDAPIEELSDACANADIVFHFAAVQRSASDEDFYEGNVVYTQRLINMLDERENPPSILFPSSTNIDNPSVFATTKKEAESLIRAYGQKNHVDVFIYKLNHIFGKYGKPDFNNVVSTFCAHVSKGTPIVINNPGTLLRLTYADDLMRDFAELVRGCSYTGLSNQEECMHSYLFPSIVYERSLGDIAKTLGDFVNEMDYVEGFERKLQDTYQWYLRQCTADVTRMG